MTSWIKFANSEKQKITEDINQKDKFKIISHLWKNKQSELAMVNVNYIANLQNKIDILHNELLEYKYKYQKLLELYEFLEEKHLENLTRKSLC